MRIVYITAGAAGMYCGACIRDNTLASDLLARGHDVELVPLYTPTVTDEPNVSLDTTFFGGVNVYLQQRFSFFRSTPWFLDRILDYSWLLNSAGRWGTRTDPRDLGEITVSMLRGESGFQRKELEKLLSWLRQRPRPDVVQLGNSLLSGLAPALKRALSCPVCCTLQGEDLFLEALKEPYRSQARARIRANAESIDQFHAVSRHHGRVMRDYLGIPGAKVRVVPLGIHVDDFQPRDPAPSRPFTVGYLARIAPEKGLHLLCEAWRAVARELGPGRSRLLVAGDPATDHSGYLRGIERRIRRWGLEDSFQYRGCLSRAEKIGFLQELDLLSVPACYDEPKGIYTLEAQACGVPVVQPRRGVFPEIIAATGGGLLVEPDAAADLARGILDLHGDPERAAELGRRGREGVREHYDARKMAAVTLRSYERLVPGDRGDGRGDRPDSRSDAVPHSSSSSGSTGVRGLTVPAPRPPRGGGAGESGGGLQVRGLSKDYATPRGALPVLSGVSLSLSRGDAVSIVGPSGSGKSTLLHILGALEPPTSGSVRLEGRNPFELEPRELARFRNRQVGFVFQDHCLLPQCSVLENVLIPTLVTRSRANGAEPARKARSLLERVGLGDRLEHRPWELSGGEKQRAALARALILDPLLLLCDEPTGNLDRRSADAVSDLLLELHGRGHTILMVVTHNLELAAQFPARFELRECRLHPR